MIRVVQGDLLAQDVDAIVNPANGFLRHGAGLAKLIADRAAPREPAGSLDARQQPPLSEVGKAWWREQRGVPTLATGDCHVTSAGALPFKGIIHTVGPVFKDGSLSEDTLLFKAHVNALRAAELRGWESVAFPAVSCGLFRFPVERAAPIALSAASSVPSVATTFVLFEDAHYEAFRTEAERQGR